MILFKREVAWQPLKELHDSTPQFTQPFIRAFKWGIICFHIFIGFKMRTSQTSNFNNFPNLPYKISYFLLASTLSTRGFTTNKDRKTNNISFESPSRWLLKLWRKVMQLHLGLSRNLFSKKYTFYLKGCVTAPNKATCLFFKI